MPVLRSFAFALPFALFTIGALVACSRPECERNSDCGAGRLCTTAGICQDRPFRPPGEVPDAGPPIIRDMGVRDTGTSTPADGGDAGPDLGMDAGIGDAGDAGIPDVGMLDGGTVASEGLVWIGEFTTGASPMIVASGRFIDDLASGVVTYRESFGSGQLSCELVRQVRPATLVGFTATRILVSGFVNGTLETVELLATGSGSFQSSQQLMPGLFIGPPDELDYEVVSSGATGSLGAVSVSSPPPYAFAPGVIAPAIGATVFAQVPPISVMWSPAALQPGLRIHLELADAPAAVRLNCEAPDGLGQIQIPTAALDAFLAAAPTAPVSLSLRYQSERIEDVPIVGRSSGIPTRFRASVGVIWPVQL